MFYGSGFEFFVWMKENCKEIFVIIMIGFVEIFEIKKVYELGVVDFIFKFFKV